MSDDVEHTFPDPPWAWRDFGSGPILVTEHSGAQVVLAAMPNNDQIVTRHPETGALVALEVDTDLARLLVAAPELLQALKAMKEKLIEVAGRHNDRTCDWDVCHARQLADAAIAKAEGWDE